MWRLRSISSSPSGFTPCQEGGGGGGVPTVHPKEATKIAEGRGSKKLMLWVTLYGSINAIPLPYRNQLPRRELQTFVSWKENCSNPWKDGILWSNTVLTI